MESGAKNCSGLRLRTVARIGKGFLKGKKYESRSGLGLRTVAGVGKGFKRDRAARISRGSVLMKYLSKIFSYLMIKKFMD